MTNFAALAGTFSRCRGGDAPSGCAAKPFGPVSFCRRGIPHTGGGHENRVASAPYHQSRHGRRALSAECSLLLEVKQLLCQRGKETSRENLYIVLTSMLTL